MLEKVYINSTTPIELKIVPNDEYGLGAGWQDCHFRTSVDGYRIYQRNS